MTESQYVKVSNIRLYVVRNKIAADSNLEIETTAMAIALQNFRKESLPDNFYITNTFFKIISQSSDFSIAAKWLAHYQRTVSNGLWI